MHLVTLIRSQWDRVAGVVLILIGVVMLIVGYHGVSTHPYVAQELAYLISGGIGALIAVAVGISLLVTADLRDEWRKLDRIEAALLALRADGTRADDLTPLPSSNGSPDQSVVESLVAAKPRRPRAKATVSGRSSSASKPSDPLHRTATERASTVRLWDRRGSAAVEVPYAREAGIALLVAMLAGTGTVIVAWRRASHAALVATGLNDVGLAISGAIAVAVGATFITLLVKRAIRMRQTRLLAPWIVADIRARTVVTAAGDALVAGDWYVSHGSKVSHHRGCPLLDETAALVPPETVRTLSICKLCG